MGEIFSGFREVETIGSDACFFYLDFSYRSFEIGLFFAVCLTDNELIRLDVPCGGSVSFC